MGSLTRVRSFSELSVTTCVEDEQLPSLVLLTDSAKLGNEVDLTDIEEDSNAPQKLVIRCSVRTNEDGKVEGSSVSNTELDDAMGALVFPLSLIDMVFVPIINEQNNTLMIKVEGKARDPNVEWLFMAQVRIFTLPKEASAKRSWKSIDSDVFEFGNRVAPIFLLVNDFEVDKIRLMIRFVHQIFDELPKFDDGDVLLRFPSGDGECQEVITCKALLQLHSPVLAASLKGASVNADGLTVLSVADCSVGAFRELLYQLYPTQRPIYADFRALSIAAVKFKVGLVLDKLVGYLVRYEHMGFEQKIREAIVLGLDEAISELVFNAVKSGQWSHMINRGFDAKSSFSDSVYYEIICPAVAKALVDPSPFAYCRRLLPRCDFTKSSDDSSLVRFKVQGRSFFVNKGVLRIHNDTKFGRGNDGEYYINMTIELRNELDKYQLKMEDVMEELLFHLYGLRDSLHLDFVRPLLIFADVHQMKHLKGNLEEMLLLEPPITPNKLLDHLLWAEKYHLKNLERTTMFRMEGSYKEAATKLVKTVIFQNTLSAGFQTRIIGCLKGKWANMNADRMYKSCAAGKKVLGIGARVVLAEDEELKTLCDLDLVKVCGEPTVLEKLP